MAPKADKSSDLPAGWEVRPLGEVVQPTRPRIKPSDNPGLPFIGMENIEAQTMKLLGTVPARTMKSSAVHFQAGDVLYGRLRPYLNKVYRPDFEGLCSAEFIVFPKTEGIESRYLQYFLNSSAFVSYSSHLNTGDRPRVDFEQLAAYPFPIAPPMQQEQIVAEIEKQFSRLDEAVANLNRVRANLRRYRAAVLKAAVEGTLMSDGRATSLVNWRQLTLPQLCASSPNSIRRGPFGSAIRKEYFVLNGYKVYEQQNAIYDDCSLGNYYLDEEKFKELSSFEVRPGDLIVSCSGTVGRIAIVPSWAKRGVINQALLKLTLKQDTVLNPYFVIMFRHKVNEILTASARGSAMQNITGVADLKKIQWPIPPLPEQGQIVAEVERRLSVVDELETAVEANVTRADRLRHGVLKSAFAGKMLSSEPVRYIRAGGENVDVSA